MANGTPDRRARAPLFWRLAAVAAFALALVSARTARADVKPKEEWQVPPNTRRGGFSVGVTLGAGVSSVAGFPNNPKKIGFQSAYTETGVRPGTWFSAWLGGAFTDWLSFGIGFGGNSMLATDHGERVSAGAFLFHTEGFPAFPFTSGRLRNLGVFLDAGTGPVSVKPKNGNTALVDGGATSLVGFGVFWEGLRFAHLGNGPFLTVNYMFSDSARRPAVFAGWRTALYAGAFGR